MPPLNHSDGPLKALFDFQRFEKNPFLEELIQQSCGDKCRTCKDSDDDSFIELDDEDLAIAAGGMTHSEDHTDLL